VVVVVVVDRPSKVQRMDEVLIGSIIASTLRVSVPLILCALAGVMCERAGVIDLGLEGKMLLCAFTTASVGVATGSLPLALFAALLVGLALSLLHGYACVSHGGDQVVFGMAVTMTAAGLTVVLGIAWFAQGGQTPPLPDTARLSRWFVGAGEVVAQIPLVGRAIALAFFGHNWMVYGSLALVAGVWWLQYRTRFGLRLRATGENPAMVDAAGVSVAGMRYQALALNGALSALAGAYLVVGQNPSFIPNMTAGRGYMALAALIFGKWHPVGALWACLLFGFLDAVSIRLQGVELPGIGAVPVQAIQALPYVLTVVLLAGFIGKSTAPAALGRPYVKDR
jgi:general nucleoside transport system permease protein